MKLRRNIQTQLLTQQDVYKRQMFTPDFIDTSLLGYRTFQHLACSSLFYSLVPEERDFGPDLHLYDAGFQDFGELFGRIFREYREKKKGYCEIIRAYVTELLVKTLRACLLYTSRCV